uniref:WAP domain-containing protein n=1 Tax=Gopherus evgoodei TaxID=1825980 RepID=A0A8C4W5T1_9SAUR
MAGASHGSSACCPALQGGVYTVHIVLAVKSGTCPVITVWCQRFDPPDHCQSDSQCAGAEKCCDSGCGLGCVLPQLAFRPTMEPRRKPGTCPVVTCAMYNPPNRCHSDYQCPGFKKCCETFCGRTYMRLKGLQTI